MSGHLEVVCGIAGTGKTARLLELFRREQARLLEACTPGEAVWITPTNRSRREIARRLLDPSLRACLAPNVLTFDTFAERLLRTSGSQIVALSLVARRMIARAVIDDAQATGSLSYFTPIAHTSGFLDLFLDFVSELKRDETWPEQFEQSCRRRGWLPREADLSLLYDRYQARLNELSLYDAEGRFWSARSLLEEGRRGAFDRLALVIVDGFADFTQPQYEILEHLADHADRVIVSLPLEKPCVRADLFAKSSVALEEIDRKKRATVTWLEPTAVTSQNADATFRHIALHLFGNPRDTPRLTKADGFEIIEAAGPTGEARALAERIKKLLLDGVAADEVVIAMRGADSESDILRETLTAAGIPNAGTPRSPFSRTPLARTLLMLLESELEDWSFGSLCALLRSNHFRPNWSSVAEGQGVQAAVRILRKWKLGADRRRILRRLSTIAEDADPPAGQSDATQSDARGAVALLRDLSNATDRLRQPATFTIWIDRLVSLCDELGISPRENGGLTDQTQGSDLDQRDREHWRRLKDVLYDAAQTLSLLGDDREIDLSAFVRCLKDILDSQHFPTLENPAGKVLVLEAGEVRNLDVRYLFLAGLTESSFPRSRPDDCLYTQSERRRARKTRVAADTSSPQQDEMLLFYSIVTRARSGLTLSFPSVSATGQPLFSSPYVAALRSLFVPEALCVTASSDLDPVPSRERTLTVADLRLVATAEVREKKPALFRLLADRPDSAPAARSILASALMAAARNEQSGFSAYEGMLEREANRKRVADLFHRDYQFSATQLQSYATCPFRFLLSQVLQIQPQETVETEVDPRSRGLSLHQLLRRLHDPLSPHEQGSSLPSGAEIGRLLRDLADEQFLPAEECTRFEKAVVTVERRFAELFAQWYSAQWDAYRAALGEGWDESPLPRYVELPFGDVPLRGDNPHPHAQPFAVFGTGAEQVRVQGQIDRIDVGRRGKTTAFAVIDYKTRSGERFELKDVRAGLALQLAIYVSAIRQSQLLGSDPGLFQMLYWNLTRNGCVSALKGSRSKRMESIDSDIVQEMEQALHDLLPRMVARLRSGEFPVHNDDRDCTGYCSYSTVCRVNQVRSVEQERQKFWKLAPQ
jgi:ATP-dependent helicase/nuclease subunit B